MEMKEAKAEPKPSGFEPFSQWRQEEGRDVLELHLQGIFFLKNFERNSKFDSWSIAKLIIAFWLNM
jgi:hypothetical protein